MDEIKACEKLDLKNEQTLRRIEEVRAEIAESRRKIEEFNQGNIFFKQRMDATDRETQAFQRQKGTSHLSMQLNQRAIELAKEKLARLTVSNAKMSKENTTCSLEWREHIEAGEKVLARTKALYKNAPWILDADSEKMSISAATKEAEKVWAALKTSFEAISDDGMPDEENFMQQMTIIRRLGNKIQRNNREWLKIFPKKPKRHSVVSMIDAGALLNDSLAELEEDLREDHVDENQNSVVSPLPRTPIPFKRKAEESRVSSFVKRAKLDEGDRPVQHVTFAEPIQEDFVPRSEERPASKLSQEIPVREDPVVTKPVEAGLPVKAKPVEADVPVKAKPVEADVPVKAKPVEADVPVKAKPVEADVPVKAKPVEADSPVKAKPVVTKIPVAAEPVEPKTAQANKPTEVAGIFGVPDDTAPELNFSPFGDASPSVSQSPLVIDKGPDASQADFGFNFGCSDNNDSSQNEGGFFNMFAGGDDNADGSDNNDFAFNFGVNDTANDDGDNANAFFNF